MELEIIEYIVTLVPAITATLASIGAVITILYQFKGAIKKTHSQIKTLADTTNKETKNMKLDITAVLHENAELKRELRRVLRRIHKVSDNGDE
jgi:hypothetical protein